MIAIEDIMIVEKAAEFAKVAHEGQYRKYTGEPYFCHVERVAAEKEETVKFLDKIPESLKIKIAEAVAKAKGEQ